MSNSRGFVALFSVLIISALLTVLVVASSTDIFLARISLSDEEAYRAALAAGWSCAHLALNRLSADPDRFTGAGTTTVRLSGADTCLILKASTTGTEAEVIVQGQVRGSLPRLRFTATREMPGKPYSIETWEKY